jgi:flagellar protein FliJ
MREVNMLRSKRSEATRRALKVSVLETMIRDFNNLADDLARQIATEEERTKIRDTRHVAYSTFATAAALRRRNLLTSLAELKSKLDAAKRELDEVTMQLRDLELAQSRADAMYVAAQGDLTITSPRTIEAAEASRNSGHELSMPT